MYPNRPKGFFAVILTGLLLVLIFYQLIITLILPFRFNVVVLMIEVILLMICLYRILWPY